MFKGKKGKPKDDAEIGQVELEAGGDWLTEMPAEGQLNLDMYETPTELVVVAPVAGVTPENLDIKIKDGVLSIRGERSGDHEVEDDSYHYKETFWGAFSRQISLPTAVAADKAKVTHENGVLKIRLPKLVSNSEVVLKVKP